MADKVPIDSNAGTSSQVGVGRAQQIGRALHQINPNWVEDGYGIVGPQRQVVRQNATPSGMEFGVNNNAGKPGDSPREVCNPGEGADTSLKYIKATKFVTDHWECIWLPTCASTCDS